MVKAVDIEAELAGLTVFRGRTAETPHDESEESFATLARFGDGGVFAGSFAGESPWERHPNGDELVHILKCQTTLTILTDDGPQILELEAGMLAVVPQACWHRFWAPEGVTVLTATPRPTEHSSADDPRQDG